MDEVVDTVLRLTKAVSSVVPGWTAWRVGSATRKFEPVTARTILATYEARRTRDGRGGFLERAGSGVLLAPEADGVSLEIGFNNRIPRMVNVTLLRAEGRAVEDAGLDRHERSAELLSGFVRVLDPDWGAVSSGNDRSHPRPFPKVLNGMMTVGWLTFIKQLDISAVEELSPYRINSGGIPLLWTGEETLNVSPRHIEGLEVIQDALHKVL